MTTPVPSNHAARDLHPHVAIRSEWLALHAEEALEPALPIIDAHHHLWEFPDKSYRSADLVRDITCGHNICATVFIECQTHYRTDGPEAFKSVGEVEFVLDEVRDAQTHGVQPQFARRWWQMPICALAPAFVRC